MNRRAFLHLSASGAALPPALSGCSPDASPKPEESQLLENVFSDPKGFGIGEDGKYLYERM